MKARILFFVTGSIAGFKAAQVVSRLVQEGNEVQVVASASALKFVGAATFEGLTGQRVLSDLWDDGRAMDHIHLSRWADFGVLCPASANIIGKMAHGLADDVVSTTLLAWPSGKRLHVFPAMNVEMLNAEPVRKNIESLRARGILISETGAGNLACGEVGGGRLLEPEQILEILRNNSDTAAPITSPRTSVGSASVNPARRILITGGATRESIDGIRFISNVSTGRTAAELCDRFSSFGWSVTYLHGQQAHVPVNSAFTSGFTDIENLDTKLRMELSQNTYDAVVHCAAVSDFAIETVNGLNPSQKQKMTSADVPEIKLKPAKKILPNLREYSLNKNIKVVGFKLTLNAEPNDQLAAAEKILGHGVDMIVANDWSQVGQSSGAGPRKSHPGFVLTKSGQKEFDSVAGMAEHLNEILTKDLV